MRYLVTGGAGFIGSHVVEALLARGDAVTVLDDLSTGSLANLFTVQGHAQLTVIHGSACDDDTVRQACEGCSAIIHLAAAVGVQHVLAHQVESIVNNVRSTDVMLRAAVACGKLPFFFASSSEVYGKGDHVPFKEDDDSILGSSHLHRWSYACSKKLDEFLALAYHREQQLPMVIGRFFNITGPRQSPSFGMVLPRVCQAALAGVDIEVHGDGSQSRCFLHVHDAVDAVLRLIACPAACGQIVNIGSIDEVTIIDLAKQVVNQARSTSAVRVIPYSQAFPQGGFEDMRRRVPDVSRLRALTGWSPRHDLHAIIHDCLVAAGKK